MCINMVKQCHLTTNAASLTGDGELQDFQFFNTTRLQELFDKEQNYEVFKHNQAQKEQAARAQVALPP